MDVPKEKIINVIIAPCVSKKSEIKLYEGADYVITTSELAMMIRECNQSFDNVKKSSFDKLLGESSDGGVIFGASGGVMESMLRTAYYLLNNELPPLNLINFKEIRGEKDIKEAEADLKVKGYSDDGRWLITHQNGKLVEGTLYNLFVGSIGGNPKVQEYYTGEKDFLNKRGYKSLNVECTSLNDVKNVNNEINQTSLTFWIQTQFGFFNMNMNIFMLNTTDILSCLKIFQTINSRQIIKNYFIKTTVKVKVS